MRPVRQKRIARALVAVAILGSAAVVGVVASASGRAVVSSPRGTSTDPGPVPCPTNRCQAIVRSMLRTSSLTVQAKEVPRATAPSSARPAPANKGMLTTGQESDHPLVCTGYRASDPTSYQFYLGESTLGNVLYSVTYRVKRTVPGPARLCLGARFSFKTNTGAHARPATLPNGLKGFVGVLPMCRKGQIGQLVACVVRTNPATSSADAVLTTQVPAIGGDPWVRS